MASRRGREKEAVVPQRSRSPSPRRVPHRRPVAGAERRPGPRGAGTDVAARLYDLQRSAGNAAVARAMAAGRLTTVPELVQRGKKKKKTPQPPQEQWEDIELEDIELLTDEQEEAAAVLETAAKGEDTKKLLDKAIGLYLSKKGKKGEAKLGGGGEASAEVKKYLGAIELLVKGGVLVGASLEVKDEYEKQVGGFSFLAGGGLKTVAGAWGGASGSLKAGLTTGITGEGRVEVGAGVKFEAKGELGLGSANQKRVVALLGKVEALAGAEASAEGIVKLRPEGIALEGKLEAFAGVSIKGSAELAIGPKDSEFLKLALKGQKKFGAGAELGGKFAISKNKIMLGADLAAALKLGAGLGFEVEANPDAIMGLVAKSIYNAVCEEFFKPEVRKQWDLEMKEFPEGTLEKTYGGT